MGKTLLDEFEEHIEISEFSKINSKSLTILPSLKNFEINDKINLILNSENIKKLKLFRFGEYLAVCDEIDLYLSEFSDSIFELLPKDVDIQGVSFLLYELLINIYKHSKFENSYIQINISPDEQQIDICIIDDGIGIPKSFYEGQIDYKNDCEAIYQSINGKTTDKEKYNLHGRGLNTSVRLTTLGFDGEILIASSKGVCYITSDGAKLHQNKRRINGTFIMLRINNKKIENIYECIKFKKINKLEVDKND
ncbi:ATP-binding protein [Methanobrevibacter sp.]|uniref:ATP-binding protein n=1 Tax=Methanobrevibacter sp. TaxID=66852 RepID=UPI003870A0A5